MEENGEQHKQLRKIWLKFLLSLDGSEERNKWLDIFLAKYLSAVNDESAQKHSELGDWRSVGNILAHHLLTDIHHVCCQMSQGEKEREEEEIDNTEPLWRYLFHGRGWKLLWTLESIGLENLACTRELANLIISLVPLCITFPVSSSTLPDYLKRTRPVISAETCFGLSKVKRAPTFMKRKLKCYTSGKTLQPHSLRRSDSDHKRTQYGKSYSSSDEDGRQGFSVPIIPTAHRITILRNTTRIDHGIQPRENSDLDDDRQDQFERDAMATDCSVAKVIQCSVSVIEFCDFVIHILQRICLLDQKSFSLCSSSSSLVLPFAMDTLNLLHFGQCNLVGWSKSDFQRLQNQLLKLVLASAGMLISLQDETGALNENGVLRTLLVIAADLLSLDDDDDDSKPGEDAISRNQEEITFICEAVVGTLLLICRLAERIPSAEDCVRTVHIVRTFSTNSGPSVCCFLILYLENQDTTASNNQVCRIISFVKDAITTLKRLRMVYNHQSAHCSCKHHKCNLYSLYHHHDNILGTPVSHSLTNKMPICCIATMNHLLLKIYTTSKSKATLMCVLKALRAAGICCCIKASFVLENILLTFPKHEREVQCTTLAVLEKTLLKQLGLTASSQTLCQFCENQHTTLNHDNTWTNELTNVGSLSNTSTNGGENCLWTVLNLYSNLLMSDNEVSHLIGRHILHLIRVGTEKLKCELFVRIILPVCLTCKLPVQQRIPTAVEYCLAALPSLFPIKKLATLFLSHGGLQCLCVLLHIPHVQHLALQVLKVLMISEAENMELTSSFCDEPKDTPIECVLNLTVLAAFHDILFEQSKLHLKMLKHASEGGDKQLILGNDSVLDNSTWEEIYHTSCIMNEPGKSNWPDSYSSNKLQKIIEQAVANKSAISTFDFTDKNICSLSFLCDLWSTCRHVVIRIPAYRRYLSLHQLSSVGYELLLLIIKNISVLYSSYCSGGDNALDDRYEREHFKNNLSLIESLLSVCLLLSPFTYSKKFICHGEILDAVRRQLECYHPLNTQHLRQLFDVFLHCALHNSEQYRMQTVFLERDLPCVETADLEILYSLSEASDDDMEGESTMDEGYEGDLDTFDSHAGGENYVPSPGNFTRNVINSICQKEVCKMILDLLIHFHKSLYDLDYEKWIPVVLHIVHKLANLCEENKNNAALLYSQNTIDVICKGMRNILTVSDSSHIEVQQALMNLFALIAEHSLTLEELHSVLDLFKSPSAPYDILLQGLNLLSTALTLQPSYFLCFPNASQNELPICNLGLDVCMPNAMNKTSPDSVENLIYSLQAQFKNSPTELPSAWGVVSAVLPLSTNNAWSPHQKGFSVSLWLLLNQDGTNQDNFNATKKMSKASKNTSPFLSRETTDKSLGHSRVHSEDCELHLFSIGLNVLFEVWTNSHCKSFHFRITNYTSSSTFTCLAESTCGLPFLLKQWHHVVLNCTVNSTKKFVTVEVEIIVDGYNSKRVVLKYENPSVKKSSSVILIGHSSSSAEQRNLKTRYCLGNMTFFKGSVFNKDTSYYCYGMGPDFYSLTDCALEVKMHFFPTLLTPEILQSGIDPDVITGWKVPNLTSLQESLLAAYSPENPYKFTIYPQVLGPASSLFTSIGTLKSSTVSPSDFRVIAEDHRPSQQQTIQGSVIFFTQVERICVQGLHSATKQLGGIAIFVFLFARIVESSDDEKTQANALRLLFSLIKKNPYHANHYLQMDGLSLVKRILESRKCITSYHMLEVFMSACLSGHILDVSPFHEEAFVDDMSDAIITCPSLFSTMLSAWSVWEKKCLNVPNILFSVLLTLLRDHHPHYAFNRHQMITSNVLEIILNMLKEKVVYQESAVMLEEVALIIPKLIRKLIGSPPDLNFLKLVCNCLLLLHQATNTYVCQIVPSHYVAWKLGKKKTKGSAKSLEENIPLPSHSFSKETENISDRLADVTIYNFEKPSDNFSTSGSHCAEEMKRVNVLKNISGTDEPDAYISISRTQIIDLSDTCVSKPHSLDINKINTLVSNEDEVDTCQIIPVTKELFPPSPQYKKYDLEDTSVKGIDLKIMKMPTEDVTPMSTEEHVSVEDNDLKGFELISSSEEEQEIIPDVPKCSLTTLCTGLLALLEELLHSLPDNMTIPILDIVKPEVLIVLTHNPSYQIRAAVVKVLASCIQHASEEDINEFLKIKGFYLLANQLHQYSAHSDVLEACFSVVTGHSCSMTEKLNISNKVIPYMELSVTCTPILAMLPNCVHDIALCHNALSALYQICLQLPISQKAVLTTGFPECLAQLAVDISHTCLRPTDLEDVYEQDILFEDIHSILQLLSFRLFSCKGSSNFQAFCDLHFLFNLLEHQSVNSCGSTAHCVTVLRDCQCVIFQSAVDYVQANFNGDAKHVKDLSSTSSDSSSESIWDTLLGLPDTLNPIFTSSSESINTQTYKSFSSSDGSKSPTWNDKGVRGTRTSEIVDRFRQVLVKAMEFIINRDLKYPISQKEKNFVQNMLQIIVHGNRSVLEHNRRASKTLLTSMMWSMKDIIRSQLNKLLLHLLAPGQPSVIHWFVIDMLVREDRCTDILKFALHGFSGNDLTLAAFLDDLLNEDKNSDEKQLHDLQQLVSSLEQCQIIPTLPPLPRSDEENSALLKAKHEWLTKWKEWKEEENQVTFRKRERLFQKHESLQKQISESASSVTRSVVEIQNVERKKFMQMIKISYGQRVANRKSWHSLIDHLTHERAVWNFKDFYPSSWELDPTEGPYRVRKRLRRCHLFLEPRFLLPEYQRNNDPEECCPSLKHIFEDDSQSADSAALINKLHTNEQITYTCPCTIVTPFDETLGDILLGSHCIHYVGEESLKQKKQGAQGVVLQTWPFEDIKEVIPQRYELQDNALEVFLSNGLTYLLAFRSTKERNELYRNLLKRPLHLIERKNLVSLTQLWRDHSISNFEYLTEINKIAGRSFNDLMQYPVFPFILADYSSTTLNLKDPACYRNLSKPVAIQDKKREKYYINAYSSLKDDQGVGQWDLSSPSAGPYHYGSHYSNSGTVLHFLVRLLPFTHMFLNYQDNNFDLPDRTFHSLKTSWALASGDSTSDVKELIPEFFFMPEFLINAEGFNFGVRQSGERVLDVGLPPWCNNDPRLFVLIHRQSLESEFVTGNLHNWIDLVFGYKQTGKAAIEAINVFHPATYYGLDINKVEDLIKRRALHTMIKTVGQMPRQLFTFPHPMIGLSLAEEEEQQENCQDVLSTVLGLKWGSYVGSPSTAPPGLVWKRNFPGPLGFLLPLLTNDVIGLAQNTCLLLNHSKEKAHPLSSPTYDGYVTSAAFVTWGHEDRVVRIKLCRDNPPIPLVKGDILDPICLCASVPDCCLLFVCHDSGTVDAYHLEFDTSKPGISNKYPPVHLLGHSGTITTLCICKPYSITVTGSEDGTCVIWDLNRLCYVRSITDHNQPVKLVCVSDTLGDISSVSYSDTGGSTLKVHTINAKIVGSVDFEERITALCYSTAPEGISVNVVGTGLENGIIRLWSSWDLAFIAEIRTDKFTKPITCLTYSYDNQHLYAATVEGSVAVWEKPSKGLTRTPRFRMFL